MAQEKARPTRARAKQDGPDAEAPAKPTTRKRRGTAVATPTSRARRKPRSTTPNEVATLAYLLWERGEPGDATEHWLRAERELAA